MKAATYSRYSSDNQRETSIEDQERLQDRRAESEGFDIVHRFSDREVSASIPMIQRPGGRALLEAAHRRQFDVLLIEGLDRCWRDIIDQEQVIRGMEFSGIRIIGASDGYDTRHEDRELQRGVRGLLNQQYLRDLAKKTHRGLTGQVFRGGSAGGAAYGYRSSQGNGVMRLEVDEEQARWVRWIFQLYAEGWSCQRIAAELNRLGITTKRDGTWSVSALYGSPNKGSGVLNNELYVGRYIWNRSHWAKHPVTSKWIRQERPRHEWVIDERPELQIVTDDLWQAVRARMDGTRLANGSKGKGARPKTLLGGLMKCGKCGGAIIAVSGTSYGCAAHKDRGPTVCAGVRVSRERTDRRIVTEIRKDLLEPDAIVEIRKLIDEMVVSEQKDVAGGAETAKKELASIQKEIGNLVAAIAAMGHSEALTSRLKQLEARRAAVAARAGAQAPSKAKIDDLMARYKRHLAAIEQDLASDTEKARAAIRDYFGEIVIEETGEQAWATISANPGNLLMQAAGDSGYGCGGRI